MHHLTLYIVIVSLRDIRDINNNAWTIWLHEIDFDVEICNVKGDCMLDLTPVYMIPTSRLASFARSQLI